MKNLENISKDLFDKIRGRFPSVTIGDAEGNVTNVATDARFFDFQYKEADRVLGKVSISLDEDALAVMYTNDFVANEDSMTRDNWYNFLKELRQFSKKRLLNFDTRNITKSNLDKRDYKFLAQNRVEDDHMNESKLYGTSRISYQNFDSARLMIKHTESINQQSATGRTQKVGAIYVENADGERFKYPFKHLSGARAMARHVAEGGKPHDDFGKHITSLSEELAKLRKFKTYMGRSAVMAESLAGYMDIVKERMQLVKKTVESLQKPAYYKETFEAFETPMMEDVPSDVAENWIDELTIKQFNEELSDVFPYIYNLVKEGTKPVELGPEDLEEGPIDWAKGKIADFKQGRADSMKQYEQDLHILRTVLSSNGIDKTMIDRLEQGCLNDPRVCLYNEIRKKNMQSGDMDVEVERIGKELNSGFTTRSGTTDESEIEQALEDAMGQFSETACEDCGKQSWTSLQMTEQEIEELDDLEEGEQHGNSKIYNKCWKGYSKVPGKTAGEAGSCKKNEGAEMEAFDPKHFDGEFQGYATGDDGEEDEADIEYTATIVNGKPVVHPKSIRVHAHGNNPSSKLGHDVDMDTDMQDPEDMMQQCQDHANELWAKQQSQSQYKQQGEGNAYSGAVAKAKMNGKKKGDKVDGPDGDEITLEKEQKTPLGEFILSYFDYTTGQFPKGETAILTMVEKDYGEQYIDPAKQFLEKIGNRVSEVMGYKEEEPELTADQTDLYRLAGL